MVLIEEIDSPKAVEHKDRGNAFFSKGDYDEAVNLSSPFYLVLRKIMNQFPRALP